MRRRRSRFRSAMRAAHGRYRLLETSIKPYPAVATATAPIRAAIELHRAGLPPLDQIERIDRAAAGVRAEFTVGACRDGATRPTSRAHSTASITVRRSHCSMAPAARHSSPTQNSTRRRCGNSWPRSNCAEDAEFTALWPQSAGGAVELHLRGGAVAQPPLPLSARASAPCADRTRTRGQVSRLCRSGADARRRARIARCREQSR